MKSALTQFRSNVGRAQDLSGLALALGVQATQAIDTSDLLRASLVLAVSAFDHFVHEVTRIGILEIAEGKRAPTDAYYRFQVSMRGVATHTGTTFVWLDQEIRERHGWQTFQDPNKVADALRYVSSKLLWQEVGHRLGIPPDDAKSRLRLIVDRRNKIAHEADMDPTAPGIRWPIDGALVVDALGFLLRIAEAIHDVVRLPS